MPIAAAFPLLNNQIANALSMDIAADPNTVATIIATAVGQASSMGLLPAAPAPIPLVPAGLSAGQNLITNALNLQIAADIKIVATIMATGISLIAPLAPPAGLSYLQNEIANALSMDIAAQQKTVALMISNAIIQYYTMGGII